MKSNAPWSVKGIERDAREAAKAAAQREGMTVGEWLNQIIYTAGDPNAAPTEGEIEGLRARDLASAIEHLSRRMAAAEAKSASAIDNLARSLGGAVERLQRLERTEGGAGDPGLAARVNALEEKTGDRQRIEALRALERAVGQIAVQFNNAQQTTLTRLDSTERQLQQIAERIETAPAAVESVSANAVRDAIEGMASRIARAEKIATEAAQLKTEANESTDPDFVQKTGIRLRILGDEIKRGGDQIRTLEGTISRLSQQIDAAEKRSAEGVQKVAETIADLRSQFSSADATDQSAARAEIEAAVSEIAQRTEDRIQSLQESFDAMVRRLETAGGRIDEAPAIAAHAPPAAPLAAKPSPAQSVKSEFDSELDDAFAALDLEEPIPTEAIPQAAPAAAAAEPVEDEFGFDADDAETEDSETADVLAEIREAFGIDAPKPAEREQAEPAAEEEASLDDAVEPPPVAAAPAEAEDADANYLKAARRAAREAAAKAAEEEAAAPKKKLTPKQRAILAARMKRRKQEEAEAAGQPATALVAAPPVAERPTAEVDETSVKARVTALLAKIKTKPAAKAEDDDEIGEAPKKAAANPSLLAGATAAVGKFKKIPNATGIAFVGGAIVLLAVAGVVLMKDKSGRAKPSKRPAVAAAPVEPTATAATDERIAPGAVAADPTIRPRDLYLDNIAALKSATTDEEAHAALVKIEEAAALGHPPAQLQIGELYKLGQLYDRDLGQARQWFERAANGGNVLAMHRLGVMAARGEGGPIDPATSIKWFEMAASFGLVDSQYNLGATYHPTAEGAAGGVQNRALAYFWYSIAGKNGDTQAGEMAAGLASSMPAAEKSAKDAEVAAWAPRTPDPLANELAPAS